MRKAVAGVVVLMLVAGTIWAQGLQALSVRAELVTPKASVAETQKQGYGAAVSAIFSLGHDNVRLAALLDFVSFTADYKWVQGKKIEYDSRYTVTLAAGPRIGNERGAYIFPALSVSFGSLYSRPDFKEEGLPIGLDFSVGTVVPVGGRFRADLGVRLAMTNFFTESIPEATWGEGLDIEMLTNMFCLYAGLAF